MRLFYGSREKWAFALVLGSCVTAVTWRFVAVQAADRRAMMLAETKAMRPPPRPPELIQKIPAILPGDGCAEAQAVYGIPTEQDEYSRMWQKQQFAIAIVSDKMCTITGIGVYMEAGHTAFTHDGVILGQNTLADVERIVGPRIPQLSKAVQAPEGNWEAIIEIDPTPDLPYKTLYRATLPAEIAARMPRRPVFEDFRYLPVSEYALDIYKAEHVVKK